MRLIDADELLKRIAKWIHDPCGREETLEQMLVNDIGASVCMEIEEMPTAFDKEKVIEELIASRFIYAGEDVIGESTSIRIDNAIKIVEKGGIK